MSTSWLRRSVRTRISFTGRASERAAGRRGRPRFERVLAAALSSEVLLDMQEVVTAALDDGEQLGHGCDLLALLLEESVQELLADELAVHPSLLHELDDLVGYPLFLLEREGDRRDRVRELRLRRIDPRDQDLLVRVEQVLDDDHRVVPFLDRLAVEVCGQLVEGLGVVVDLDRDVLLRRAELVADLSVQGLG